MEHSGYGLLESVRQYAAGSTSQHDRLHANTSQTRGSLCSVWRHRLFGKLDDLQQKSGGQFSEELDNFIIAIEYATDSLASKCCFAALEDSANEGPGFVGG